MENHANPVPDPKISSDENAEYLTNYILQNNNSLIPFDIDGKLLTA